MSDSERAPLASAGGGSKNHNPREPDNRESEDASESTPLLSSSAATPRYDGERDDAHHGDAASVASRATNPASVGSAKSGSIRWPSVIAMFILSVFALLVLVLAFILPNIIEEYAKEAVVLEPTDLSLVSLTSDGVKVRIQGDFRVEAQRVKNDYVRRVGRTVSFVVGQLGSDEETTIGVYLPDYDNILIGTGRVPPMKASIVDGRNNALDFEADLVPGDAEGIRMIANEWLLGRLDGVKVKAQADLRLKAGIFPIGTHTVADSMTLEGLDLPPVPQYNITRLHFEDKPVPGGGEALGVDVTIKTFNDYPVSLHVPPLAFEILVPGCDAADPNILVAAAATNDVDVRAHDDVVVDAWASIKELPDSLTQVCPNSDSSPLDMLFKKYMGGETATVFVRGQSHPDGSTPDWLAELLASITVPVPFPGRSLDNLIRSFSLTDVHFTLPDPGAEPDDPDSNPKVSGTILVLAGLPSEFNFALNVTGVRADADVFYNGDKLGELNLREWQQANSTQIPATEDHEATLKIQSRINDAPLEVTDADVLTDVIQALLFGGKITLNIKALVDVKVHTVLGELVVKAVPAEGKIPVKPLEGDILGSAAPSVGDVEITGTTPASVSLQASVNITNPTPYSARIPFISIHVESNGTTVGEAKAENLDIKPGNNTNLLVSATWNPSLGGPAGLQRGRDLLSEYLSGYNTTVTVRTHRGSIPALPHLGDALARLNLTLPAPRLSFPDDDDDDTNPNDPDDSDPDSDPDDTHPHHPPRFIRAATFHVLSSTATFTLASPLRHTTLFIDAVNATALYNHSEPVGRIEYALPLAVPPGVSETPRLPVEWSLESVGYGKLREALGGRMRLDARGVVWVRVGRWTERVWYVGRGIGAGVRL